MNNLQQIIKFFQRLRTSCQVFLFLSLLMILVSLSWFVFRSFHEKENQIHDKQILLQQQQIWVAKQSKINDELKRIISKIKSQNQNQDLSLLSDIEGVASHLSCKYELSNETQSKLDDLVLSSVLLNLSGIDISTFVQLCDALDEKKLNLSEVYIRTSKNDTLNVKCLIESINLMQR